MDGKKYAKLAAERGLHWFDNHGCCEACCYDIPELCECEKLQDLQLRTMTECGYYTGDPITGENE